MKIRTLISFSFGPILGALFGLITLPLFTWYFPQEDVGRFSMLQVMLSLGMLLFSLALHQSYVREYHEAPDKGQLLAISFWPGAVFLLLTIVVIELFNIRVSKIVFDIQDRYLDYALYIGLLLSLIINALAHVLRMQERGVAFSLTQIIPRASLLIFVLAALKISAENGFKEIVFSNILALFCSALLLIILIREDIKKSIFSFKRINWQLFKTMIYFALPLVVGSLAYWMLTAVDRIFIQNYSGFDRLGIYAVAASIASSVVIITSIFSTIWHPTVYRWAKSDIEVKKIQVVVDCMLLVVLLIWSLVGMASGLIHYLLPAVYFDIIYIIVPCFSVPLLYLLSEATMVGIGISRKSNYAMLASVVALACSILLNYVLVPVFAERGAAVASMLAFATFFVTRTESTCRLWKPIERKCIYLLLLMYMSFTVVTSLLESHPIHIAFLWLALWFISVFFYRRRVRFLVEILRNRSA